MEQRSEGTKCDGCDCGPKTCPAPRPPDEPISTAHLDVAIGALANRRAMSQLQAKILERISIDLLALRSVVLHDLIRN